LVFLTLLLFSNSFVISNEAICNGDDLAEEVTIDPAELMWVQTNGPPGGRMAKLIQSPYRHNELYALTGEHVYKSEDRGEGWQLVGALEDLGAADMAVYEDKLFVSGNGVYYYDGTGSLVNVLQGWYDRVMVSGNRLFVTSSRMDVGELEVLYADLTSEDFIWRHISPSETELSDLSMPPEDVGFDYSVRVPNIVSIGNRVLANVVVDVLGSGKYSNGHLYVSEDLGETWSRVDLGTEEDVIIANIIQDPEDPEHVIVSFKHNVMHEYFSPVADLVKESHDGGRTWGPFTDLTLESNGITDVDRVGSVYYLLSPYDGLQIIVINGSEYELREMPRPVGFEELTFSLDTLIFDFDDDNVVYGKTGAVWALGLLKSEDGMRTWRKMDEGIVASSPSIVLLHPEDQNIIFTSGNVIQEKYLTWDGGITWEPFSPTSAGDELRIDPYDPNHLLLITEMSQMWESFDLGRTFSAINQEFSFAKIFDFDVAKDDPEEIYVSNIGVGISEYVSSTGEWHYLTGSPDYAYSVRVDPEDSDVIYATYSPKKFENHSSIWRYTRNQTENYGWSEILRVENSTGITWLEFDDSDPNRVYAGVIGREGTIYVSYDRGETWRILNGNLTFTTIWGHSQLQIDPRDKCTVYAGTWGGGTYKTTNGGGDWLLLDQDHTFSPTSIAISRSDPDVIYACDRTQPKIHRSDDGGETWYTYYDFGEEYMLTSAVAVDPNDPDLIYAAAFKPPLAHKGCFLKISNGQKVADLSQGLPRAVIEVEVDEKNPDVLYVTTHIYGVFKSTDGGGTWERLDDRGTGLPRTGIYDIDVDPMNSSILYATAIGGALPDYMLPAGFDNLEGRCGVYKSTDGGGHWTLVLETVSEARGIDVDPNDNNNLYVADMMGGVWVSNDGGQSWRQENSGLGSISMTSVKMKDNYVYASTQGSGVYSGVINGDGSITWDASRSNKPRAEVFRIQVEVDPQNPNRIYASAYPGGLLRSDDGGLHWNDKNFLTPSIRVEDPKVQGYYSFAINPTDPNMVWLGAYGKGMFVSYDGMDFDMFANGQDNKMLGKRITRVVINPANPEEVYVSSEEGVFMTQDNGEHWEEMNEGLGTLDVRSLGVASVEWSPFEDGFDDGDADGWSMESGWSVVSDGGDYVLQGVGHKWASAGSECWGDYTFEAKVKLVQGGVHVNFRKCAEGRYFLGIYEGRVALNKEFNQWSEFANDLRVSEEPYNLSQWYDLRVELRGGDIAVYIDGVLKFEYTDPDPLLNGAIAFEALDDAQVHVDNVSVIIEPADMVYAGTGGYGIYRCDAANREWQSLGRTFGTGWWTPWERRMYQFSSILFDPVTPWKIYLGHFPSGFFISEDGGRTWRDSSLGLGNDGIFSLTMHPLDPKVIWAGTYNGVAKSSDGGRTWRLKSNGMPPEQWPFAVVIDDSDPNVMYASTKNGQNKGLSHRNTFWGVVMKSTDGGESWFRIMNGLDERSEFYKILIYPPNHNILFLSTSNGVYLSWDAGMSWEGINSGLSTTNNQVRDNVADNLALTQDNKYLVLGLREYGVWKADLSAATVLNKIPIASFSFVTASPTVRDAVSFLDSSRDPDGSIVSWCWEFGDGGTSDAQNPTHRYSERGNYTVKLAVVDNYGGRGEVAETLTVFNAPPTADFTFSPQSPIEDELVNFTDTCADPDDGLTSWRWDFGDGQTSSDRNPTHRYDMPGTYTVSLTVTDDAGDTGTASRDLVIRRTPTFIETPLGMGLVAGLVVVALVALIVLRKR
jgi:PKD repeat protein